jgi:AbrB family looped-hinge helix DNA binding protein
MKTVVSEKGQVTIPKPLRDRLGLPNGQVLEVRERKGKLILEKRSSRDAVDDLYGILKLGRRTDEIMEELRGSEKPR